MTPHQRYNAYVQQDKDAAPVRAPSGHGFIWSFWGHQQRIWCGRIQKDFGIYGAQIAGEQRQLYKTMAEMSELKSYLKEVMIKKTLLTGESANHALQELSDSISKGTWMPLTDSQLDVLAQEYGCDEDGLEKITLEIRVSLRRQRQK